MGELINLRTARKNRLRKEKSDRASQNRVLFGQTGTEKLVRRLQADMNNTSHENHRRTKPANISDNSQNNGPNGDLDSENSQ